MKKGIYQGPGKVEIAEAPVPGIAADGVLVRNLCAAVCGSDVHAYKYDGAFARIFPGDEFGHEMVSEVVEVGSDVTSVKPGQRIYPFPLFAKADPGRSGTVGGFSEYMELPHFRLNMSAFPVDDAVSDEAASLIEPLTVGWHAAKLAAPSAEQNAVVFGAGMIGMASAIALRRIGIKDLMISDISDVRLAIAEDMGFKTCNVSRQDLAETVGREFGLERGQMNADIFIDAAGIKANLDLFLSRAKRMAKMCVVAVYHRPVELDLMKLTYGQYQIIGSPAYDMNDVADVMGMLRSGEVPVEKLITHRFRIDQLDEALEIAGDAGRSMKVIIDYR